MGQQKSLLQGQLQHQQVVVSEVIWKGVACGKRESQFLLPLWLLLLQHLLVFLWLLSVPCTATVFQHQTPLMSAGGAMLTQ
jgi:hypothetical protein